MQESAVILSECEAGLPVLVTGVTDNGYFCMDFFLLAEYNIFKSVRFQDVREISTKIVRESKKERQI